MHWSMYGDPARMLNLPGWHFLHASTSTDCPVFLPLPPLPGGQSSQNALPVFGWKYPATHCLHAEESFAPMVANALPGAQFLQELISVAPLEPEWRPVGQALQSSARVRPMAAL
jgi:hypothetical protein